MDKEERMFKSYLARKKRKKIRKSWKLLERKRADARNLKKKKIKKLKRDNKKCWFLIRGYGFRDLLDWFPYNFG